MTMINRYYPVLTALLFIGPPLAFAQSQGCIGVNYLGAYPDRPFTGEFRTVDSTTPGTPKLTETEPVARDRDGRIRDVRFALHSSSPQPQRTTTLTMHDGTIRTVTSDELSEVILIFDCSAGTTIQIQPGMQIARTTKGQPPASPPPLNRKYSSGFCPSAGSVKPNPHLQYEELGLREFQGIVALGCRYTTVGPETDEQWNSKPVRSDEQWVSDDFAAFLLIIRKDFTKGTESRTELIDIKLGDPDPDLFKVPDGYLVNPTPAEMPKSFNSPQSSTPRLP